jgi:hypothetical protein
MTKTWWEVPMGGSVLSFLKTEKTTISDTYIVIRVSKVFEILNKIRLILFSNC